MRMDVSDETLALMAADGDREAFSDLLGRRYDGLFRLAFRLTGNRADAEDLTQDICAQLAVKLVGFRAGARFTTWLYRVVVNAAHDRRRRATTRAKAADGWGDWEKNRRAGDAETAEQIDWLGQVMSRLPEEIRVTLALILEEEMTQAAAAEVLNVPEGTISWRVSEAKKQMRAIARQEEAE